MSLMSGIFRQYIVQQCSQKHKQIISLAPFLNEWTGARRASLQGYYFLLGIYEKLGTSMARNIISNWSRGNTPGTITIHTAIQNSRQLSLQPEESLHSLSQPSNPSRYDQ